VELSKRKRLLFLISRFRFFELVLPYLVLDVFDDFVLQSIDVPRGVQVVLISSPSYTPSIAVPFRRVAGGGGGGDSVMKLGYICRFYSEAGRSKQGSRSY
jgi:hypothetical protein